MKQSLRIAIVGLGTVGSGVVDVLQKNADIIVRNAGRPIEIVAVHARDKNKNRGVDLSAYEWVENPRSLPARNDIDCIVELVGGAQGVAKDLCFSAIAHHKHVVTANKAMLAYHLPELAKEAEKTGADVRFEAAVAGGIPIVKALREGLAANHINRIRGILNGTCNYILTEMAQTGRAFGDVLAEAQAKGYAEADPSFDVDGIDTAHKITILAMLAFGQSIDFNQVKIDGIRRVSDKDMADAKAQGCAIKLIACAELKDGRPVITVSPMRVPLSEDIGRTDGVFNAVECTGDFVGAAFFKGRGAGAGPTASAVVADLIDIATGRKTTIFGA